MFNFKVLALSFLCVTSAITSANAGTIKNNILDATSDTTHCELVSKPEFGKKVESNYILNKTKLVTADIFQTDYDKNHKAWLYVVKQNNKVVANFVVAYQGSNNTANPYYEFAFGSCGGFKTQQVHVVNKNKKPLAKFKLGSFNLTQPRGTLIPVEGINSNSYKDIIFK